jgi:hypothetical protein
MSPRWSITHLEDMPTLAAGPDADLEFDNGHVRVWLRRLPAEDGRDGPQVVVQERQVDGSWR